jgi:Na+-transporting methylmalonyl-CoA/oxaloacetate decarboxylase gamma subunit
LANITQGLFVFAVGMLILFIALGLLALMIDLIGRAFKQKGKPQVGLSKNSPDRVTFPPSSDMEASAVAVAVAVSHLLSGVVDYPDLGKLLETPPGPYRFHQNFVDKPALGKELKG